MMLTDNKRINLYWAILVALTLFTTLIAEEVIPSYFTVLVVCFAIFLKGKFIMDEFMGLREAIPVIRYTIYSYFILLPIFISICIIFPEFLLFLTTIN